MAGVVELFEVDFCAGWMDEIFFWKWLEQNAGSTAHKKMTMFIEKSIVDMLAKLISRKC